jgi:mRNA degradation ribonuclease J1/J2
VLDAHKGEGRQARFLYKQEQDIAIDTDLTSAFAEEIARNREAAGQAGVVASAVGVDAERWKFTRVVLSEQEPTGREQGTAYQVLYLAQPLLAELPKVGSRALEPAS